MGSRCDSVLNELVHRVGPPFLDIHYCSWLSIYYIAMCISCNTNLTDDIHCDLLQVLFYVHCCLSISLRPDPIQQLVTTLIEGGKKSLQMTKIMVTSKIKSHTLHNNHILFCQIPFVEGVIIDLSSWLPYVIVRN